MTIDHRSVFRRGAGRLRLAGALALALAGGSQAALAQVAAPSFVVPGTLRVTAYNGVNDDLLTGGLGKTGLASATPPAIANPLAPTAAELRRLAIYTNYNGLADVTPGGGYGVLFGPNVDANLNDTGTQGLVPGTEYLAYADDGSGRDFVTVMAQIPTSFNPNAPCIMTAPSSGSRGVYGEMLLAEWGLRNGCAVAFTDKGTGSGIHDLDRDLTVAIDGTVASAAQLGAAAQFRVPPSAELDAYKAANPNRVAIKHAHSRNNPQRNWGQYVLQSIKFTLYALNTSYPGRNFTAANTIVIAAGISNGGAAVLQAAEQDSENLIRGVVASEPGISPLADGKVVINFAGSSFTGPYRTYLDYFTLMNLYAPCASLDASLAGAPLQSLEPATSPALTVPARANRCASLKDLGLLTAGTTAGQATEALALLNGAGWLPDQNQLLPAHEFFNFWRLLAQVYGSAYARASVPEDLCGISLAATDANGRVTALTPALRATAFATGSGLPGTAGTNQITDGSANGPILQNLAVSRLTGRQDLDIDSAICLRSLATGTSIVPNQYYSMRDRLNSLRAQAGAAEARGTGNLGGKPAIIVHGRGDALLPPNFHSRPYFGLNQLAEGTASKLRYIEVPFANHFDAYVSSYFAYPGGNAQLLPLHYYLTRSLDRMLGALRGTAALPDSQVMRTTPRGFTALTKANVATFLPDLATTASSGNAIVRSGGTVVIPR